MSGVPHKGFFMLAARSQNIVSDNIILTRNTRNELISLLRQINQFDQLRCDYANRTVAKIIFSVIS